MLNVLLLTTSIEEHQRSPIVQTNSHYPIGLAYLHSYIESKGHEVGLLFLNDFDYETCYQTVRDRIKAKHFDVVGFQLLAFNRTSAFRLIEEIHQEYPDIKIIIGGVHTTVMYEQILNRFPYLIAVLGEGELTFTELLACFEKKEPISSVKGIAFVQNGQVVLNPARELIDNLDDLPFPKHELFFHPNRTRGNILTSRGCPFSCSFCCLDSISHRRVRFRSVSNVIAEIEWMVKNFPQMTYIWIHDDSFFLDQRRVLDFCDQIVKRNIKIRFICSARFKPVSKEMITALEKAGFFQVLFGLESGSARILKSCKKNITPEDVIYTYQLFAKSKIITTTFLIVGLPGENEETVQETIDLVKKIQKIKYTLYSDIGILTIYPGTEVYEIAKRNHFIDDSYWLTDQFVPFFQAEHSLAELIEYKNQILNHVALDRFLTPKGFFKQLDRLFSIFCFVWKSRGPIFFGFKDLLKTRFFRKNR
jgi:radical SAM superfamily enzyme YgiQ (UPF0313 family)